MKAPCPICRKVVAWEGNPYRPFCSERCRGIDLGTWAAEGYRIPGSTAPDSSEEEDDPAETGFVPHAD